MANLYDLLMAKERGNIKDAPNKQRIGQAPLNLRSAMKYAVGGLTDADISAYVQANIGNPAAIAEAAQKYQVTADDLARATGYSPQEVNTYFSSAGVGGPYREPQQGMSPEATRPPETMSPREAPPPPPRYEEPTPDPRPRNEEPPPRPRYEEPPEIYPVDRQKEMEDQIARLRDRQEQEDRLRQLESMKRQRESEEYYWKMRNRQNPPLPPVEEIYNPGPAPSAPTIYPDPIAPAYPPNYFDPQPPQAPNYGYPLAPPPQQQFGGPVQTNPMPPSTGLLGQLGSMFQPAGLGSSGQSAGGLGAGLPGQSMQGQAGTGQSLDSLINYLATQRKS
jgi:hypothetical protein